MKKARRVAVRLVFLTLVLCVCPRLNAASNHEPQDLTLKVSSLTRLYKLSGPVEVGFTLKNVGKTQQVVPRHLKLRANLKLEVVDQVGKSAEWCGRLAEYFTFIKSNYRTLAPGESLQGKLTVSCVNAGDPSRAWGYRMPTPGKYTIRAVYQLTLPKEYFKKAFPDARVVTAPVSSGPLTIELK